MSAWMILVVQMQNAKMLSAVTLVRAKQALKAMEDFARRYMLYVLTHLVMSTQFALKVLILHNATAK